MRGGGLVEGSLGAQVLDQVGRLRVAHPCVGIWAIDAVQRVNHVDTVRSGGRLFCRTHVAQPT